MKEDTKQIKKERKCSDKLNPLFWQAYSFIDLINQSFQKLLDFFSYF